jgi:hypothetical protein
VVEGLDKRHKMWYNRGTMDNLTNRHMAIMDALVMFPEETHKTLAERLGYSPEHFSTIVNQPLFKMAFAEFRRRHENKLSEKVIEATAVAVDFVKETIESKEAKIDAKIACAKEIFALGHAKAVDKKATVNLEAEVSEDLIRSLAGVAKELTAEFQPTKLLRRPDGEKEDRDA